MSIYTLITDKLDWTGLSLNVYIQPGAGKTALAGVFDGSLKIRLAARAQEGQANRALCQFLAATLSVPKSSITIKHGLQSRQKVVLIAGNPEQLKVKIESLINVVPGV